jgi:signal transduction histidine kinase
MTTGSLRLRLFLAAVLSITLALTLTGLALVRLFEQQIRDRILAELEGDLLQLVGAIEIAPDGKLTLSRELGDTRYDEPYGGRYWRISEITAAGAKPAEPLRSRSLWDADLDPNRPTGPQGETLIVASRRVSVGKPSPRELLFIIAAHQDELGRPLGQLRDQLLLSFLLIGVLLMIGAWLQVSVGLRPLVRLREQIAQIRAGESQRLSGDYPEEVAPLVAELNDVLDMREQSLDRARRRAGDLAHGLKTPLTILQSLARDLQGRKLSAEAGEIEEQAEAMNRHIERALVRARLSSGRGHAAASLEPVARKVATTLGRMPGAEDLEFEIAVPTGTRIAMEQGDLTELLGNLMDNGRKWARSRVRLRYADQTISIEDDGPGVPDAELAAIRERGRRLDETKQGSGLGLSIVEDIADIYGLHLTYGRSELGGLRVEVRL